MPAIPSEIATIRRVFAGRQWQPGWRNRVRDACASSFTFGIGLVALVVVIGGIAWLAYDLGWS